MICPLVGVAELWVVDFKFVHLDGERPTEVHTLVRSNSRRVDASKYTVQRTCKRSKRPHTSVTRVR